MSKLESRKLNPSAGLRARSMSSSGSGWNDCTDLEVTLAPQCLDGATKTALHRHGVILILDEVHGPAGRSAGPSPRRCSLNSSMSSFRGEDWGEGRHDAWATQVCRRRSRDASCHSRESSRCSQDWPEKPHGTTPPILGMTPRTPGSRHHPAYDPPPHCRLIYRHDFTSGFRCCCASSPRRGGLVSGSCSSARRSCAIFFQPADHSTGLYFGW